MSLSAPSVAAPSQAAQHRINVLSLVVAAVVAVITVAAVPAYTWVRDLDKRTAVADYRNPQRERQIEELKVSLEAQERRDAEKRAADAAFQAQVLTELKGVSRRLDRLEERKP